MIFVSIVARLFHRSKKDMDAAEILRRRAEAHAAACADLDKDPLIRARFPAFYPTESQKPMHSPMTAGAMLRRQAD